MTDKVNQADKDKELPKRVFGEGSGRKPTSGLFKENGGELYSLFAFRDTFLECCDPSGYLCSRDVLVNLPLHERWEEWKRLLTNSWFSKEVEKWRDELEIAIRARAIQAIAQGCEPKDFPQLKALAKGEITGIPKMGRPTKVEAEKKERQAKQIRGANPKAFDLVKERHTL